MDDEIVGMRLRGGGLNQRMTVRRIASGVGVERTFMVHAPRVEKIEVVRHGVARRAQLYFLSHLTYDTITYGPRVLGRLCNEAHAKGLLCAPSVGPGYDARRAVGDPHVKPRRHGAAYDAIWHAALAAGADRITITSFNEWQEGTQIEPAIPIRLGEYRYISYDGAWGLHGAAAQYAYLDRTAFWANLFHKTAAKPKP